jgi:hypothetical protein
MQTPHKLVIILNKRRELSEMLSGIGHVAIGLGGSYQPPEDLSLVTYVDADGTEYPSISDWSVVILRGGSGQMKNLKKDLEAESLPCVTYLDSMLSGGSQVQQERTRETSAEDIEILALATVGEVSQLDPLTKKFSVWR